MGCEPGPTEQGEDVRASIIRRRTKAGAAASQAVRHAHGFTMLELLVVVSIIIVKTAMALPMVFTAPQYEAAL